MSLEKFVAVYAEELPRAIKKYPDEYVFPITDAPVVIGKMRSAFERGTYNKDGRAIIATCKRLGIKHTYSAINAYLKIGK